MSTRLGKTAIAAISFTMIAGCGGGGGSSGAAKGQTLTGSITVMEDPSLQARTESEGNACGTGRTPGYGDIKAGTDVSVTDDKGATIGVGHLDPGHWGKRITSWAPCVFQFNVADLPKAAFYTLSISHRGDQHFSFDDLNAQGWNVDLQLGP